MCSCPISSFPQIIEEQLPYYGGLNGQLLWLRPQLDGSVRSSILHTSHHQQPQVRGIPRDSDDTITISAAGISAVADDSGTGSLSISASGSNFNRIQEAAARLVAIQELAKRKGAFSAEDNKIYANSLLELGQAATALALLQQTGQIKDFSVLLQPELFGTIDKQPSNLGLVANSPADQKIDEQKLEEVTEQQLSPEDILPPTHEDPYEDVNDSVAVVAPKKDSSVAEAKPVGLSIAGEGGVASSKPNAIALSGRNGLAVASPKATAIAGVSPEEAAAFSITLPSRNQLVIKTPNTAGVDDYDYSDAPLTLAGFPHTRDVPSRTGAGSDLVEKWRIAIAEDYAAKSRQAQTQIKAQPNPITIRAAPKRRLHYQ
ncbi:GH15132 [Drosophila grimshawi]|uniref:GH15132 n=1 Tax=Drosophila grimshawi TaxID=7222 RepID=B4IYB3_DROGR|nr:GH15132 [Drosophila grimshawi]